MNQQGGERSRSDPWNPPRSSQRRRTRGCESLHHLPRQPGYAVIGKVIAENEPFAGAHIAKSGVLQVSEAQGAAPEQTLASGQPKT